MFCYIKKKLLFKMLMIIFLGYLSHVVTFVIHKLISFMQIQWLRSYKVQLEVKQLKIICRLPPEFSLEAGKIATVSFTRETLNENRRVVNVKLWFSVPLQIWASDGGGTHNPPTDVVLEQQKSWGAADKVTLTSPMGEV